VIGTTERGAAVRDGEITPRLHELQGVLSVVMPTYLTENIWGYLWGKLVYGTMSFVISCVDAPAPEVLANSLARRVARAAWAGTIWMSLPRRYRPKNQASDHLKG
jgi:hypothetical protein